MNHDSATETKPRSLRERLKEATSAEILAAAEKVFADKGLYAGRMEEIAAEAGVSVGTLYNHFKDRDALYASLASQRRTELFEALDAALTRTEKQPFEQQLHAFIVCLTEQMEAKQAYLRIVMEAEHTRSEQREPALQKKTTMPLLRERIDKLLKRGLKARVLRADDAEVYSTMLLGILRGTMIRRLQEGFWKDVPPQQRADALVRFFLHGAGGRG